MPLITILDCYQIRELTAVIHCVKITLAIGHLTLICLFTDDKTLKHPLKAGRKSWVKCVETVVRRMLSCNFNCLL